MLKPCSGQKALTRRMRTTTRRKMKQTTVMPLRQQQHQQQLGRNSGLLFLTAMGCMSAAATIESFGVVDARAVPAGDDGDADGGTRNGDLEKALARPIKLGIVSGDWNSEFFQQVEVGWNSGCDIVKQRHSESFSSLSSGPDGDGVEGAGDVECIYSGTNWTEYANTVEPLGYYTHGCTWQMDTMLDDYPDLDAMSVACLYDQDRRDVIPTWMRASNNGQRPLVAFDAVPPPEFPIKIDKYIGTDNKFLGRTLARLVKQLRPEGGDYGLIYHTGHQDRSEGFRKEIQKFKGREGKAQWHEIQDRYGYQNFEDPLKDMTHDKLHEVMQDLALQNPTAIIFLYQTPMRQDNYTAYIDQYTSPRNITVIGTDGSNYQLDYLSRRYVNGLVGQLPYDMGQFAAREMYELVLDRRRKQIENGTLSSLAESDSNSTSVTGPLRHTRSSHIREDHLQDEVHSFEYVPTNLVAYNLIPLELPPLDVDQSLLGNLVVTGYVCFGIVATCSLIAIGWTYLNRDKTVVRASQPGFLIMTATGVLVMSSAIIPLSFDDDGDPASMSRTYATGICMSIPWLAFTGFTVTFSALFSKTWRINRVFGSSDHFRRTQVTVKDVMLPFVALLSLNFLVLILWTIIDPLVYERRFLRGTDFWNREYESIGTCTSDYSAAFLTPLAFINFFVLVIACYEAWRARNIKTEFSESKYIGLAVFSMVQAFLTGIPIVAIVRDIPEAFYLVLTFLIFILSMILLLLIFFPKMTMQRRYSKMPMSAQRKHLKQSVRNSSIGQNTNHSGRLQRESHDMMEAAKIAQEQYEARKRSRGIVDSNASSIDSGFGSSDPMIQSGLIVPHHKSGALEKSKPCTCDFKSGDLKAEDSGDISMSSVTGAGLTLSSSSASILAGLFTSLELETILRNNGIVIEDVGSLPKSSDVDLSRDLLISRVAKMLAERAYQKYGVSSESPPIKGPIRRIENIDEVGRHSQMASIVEENSMSGNEFENKNSDTGVSPLVEQAPWPSMAESTSSSRRNRNSDQTDETSDETLNGSVRTPKEEGIQVNYSEADTSIVEA